MGFKVDGVTFRPHAGHGLGYDSVPIGYWAVTGISWGRRKVDHAEAARQGRGHCRQVPGLEGLVAWAAVFRVQGGGWVTKEAKDAGCLPVEPLDAAATGERAEGYIARIKAGENPYAVAYELILEEATVWNADWEAKRAAAAHRGGTVSGCRKVLTRVD